MKDHFTTREVGKILDLSESRIRGCVRAGILSPPRGPGRRRRFTFQDLLVLRTTKGLLDARVPIGRIRRIVQSLRRQLPDGEPLSSVNIYADGRHVLVHDGSSRWQPDSGQFLLNFEARTIAERVSLPSPRRKEAAPTLTAEQWFDLGCDLETESRAEALHAYRQAIALDPTLAPAHINVGRLYQQAREMERAEEHYRHAIHHAPGYALAYFNLGVLLEECDRPEEALAAYGSAVARDADFADAHYNLALLCEKRGLRPQALTHFRTAKRIYEEREKE
jgi:DNA-binding transcriptional MerR regulator